MSESKRIFKDELRWGMSTCRYVFGCISGLLMVIIFAGCGAHAQSVSMVEHIEPDDETGSSLAVIADSDLAFTAQLFPVDEEGDAVAPGDARAQSVHVLNQLDTVLEEAGASLESLVRLHVYLADDRYSQHVQEVLAAELPEDSRPAVTYATGTPAHPDVLISLDAVAAVPSGAVLGSNRITFHTSSQASAAKNRADVATVTSARKLFVSGQAESADNVTEATNGTMRSLLATLAYAGASARDVAQVRAFIHPMDCAEEAVAEIARFFSPQPAPPIVVLEWFHDSFPVEIELVAAAPSLEEDRDPLLYDAPPWLEQATTFSRIVDVSGNRLLFTSGLTAAHDSGYQQARSIFQILEQLLETANSDFSHLVKGTYLPTTDDGRDGLMEVRTDYFNPERPPSASLAMVRGTGRSDATLSLDMISLIPD